MYARREAPAYNLCAVTFEQHNMASAVPWVAGGRGHRPRPTRIVPGWCSHQQLVEEQFSEEAKNNNNQMRISPLGKKRSS